MSLLKRIISRLFGLSEKPPEKPIPETEEERNWKRFRAQIGDFRFYLLFCAGFKMPPDMDMAAVSDFKPFILQHFEALYKQYRDSDDKPDIFLANVAAGILTYGRLEMVDVILANLPYDEYLTDHGAGKCFLIPMNVMAIYLGIPRSICPTSPSYGRMDRQAVLEWLAERRSRLIWNTETERFILLDE